MENEFDVADLPEALAELNEFGTQLRFTYAVSLLHCFVTMNYPLRL